MIPKVYLSPKDVTVNNGSVIAGNNVSLNGGNVTNTGSTLLARNNLSVISDDKITNSNDALIKAGGNVDLSAIGDISNISSAISGKTVALESLDGGINNLTLADQYSLDTKSKRGAVSIKDTTLGSIASITAIDGLSLAADKDITLTGSTLAAGGNLLMDAGGNIAVNTIEKNDAYSQSGFWNLYGELPGQRHQRRRQSGDAGRQRPDAHRQRHQRREVGTVVGRQRSEPQRAADQPEQPQRQE